MTVTTTSRKDRNIVDRLKEQDVRIRRLQAALARATGGGGGVTDHGALTGNSDDDHTQYLKVDGTRHMAGDLNMSGNTIDDVLTVRNSQGNLYLYSSPPGAAGDMRMYVSDSGGVDRLRFTIGTNGDLSWRKADGATVLAYWDESANQFVHTARLELDDGVNTDDIYDASGVKRFGFDGTYTYFYNNNGSLRVWLAADSNYYNANTHNFRTSGSAQTMTISSVGRVTAGEALIATSSVQALNGYLYGTDSGNYLRMYDGYHRFYTNADEVVRFTSSSNQTYLDLMDSSHGHLRNTEGGSLYITNEVANTDIFIRTDNGSGPKNRLYFDGSGNTILFYNHDGTEVFRFSSNQLRAYNSGSASAPSYSWREQSNSGMYWVESTKRIYFANQGTADIIMTQSGVYPGTSNVEQLGNSTLDWKDVWAIDTSINSSDENLKTEIAPIDPAVARALIREVQPIEFKWIDGGSRFHWGYGARQLKASLEAAGLDPSERAIYIDPTYGYEQEEAEGFIATEEEKQNPRRDSLRLRPVEMVPVVMAWAKDADERIEALEADNKKLRRKNNSLERRLRKIESHLGL